MIKSITIKGISVINWEKVISINRFDNTLEIVIVTEGEKMNSVTPFKCETIAQLNTEWVIILEQIRQQSFLHPSH